MSHPAHEKPVALFGGPFDLRSMARLHLAAHLSRERRFGVVFALPIDTSLKPACALYAPVGPASECGIALFVGTRRRPKTPFAGDQSLGGAHAP